MKPCLFLFFCCFMEREMSRVVPVIPCDSGGLLSKFVICVYAVMVCVCAD